MGRSAHCQQVGVRLTSPMQNVETDCTISRHVHHNISGEINMKILGKSRVTIISRSVLPILSLAPLVTFAWLAGTYYVTNITNGNGLENTTSFDDDAIRQQATTLLISQQGLGFWGLVPWKQYKIVFADGGYQHCQAALMSSTQCALLPTTYVPPNDAVTSNATAQHFICSLQITENGAYVTSSINIGGWGPVYSTDWISNGYSTSYVC